MTLRTIDNNGYMLVRNNPLTKVGVYSYMGYEVNGAPDPNKIYRVYRPAEELEKPETIESFKLLPLIDEHEVLGKDATPAEQKGVQGTVGSNVHFEYPYLRSDLRVWSNAANAMISTKQKTELSPAYRCVYDWTPGEFNGERYDVVQREIRANHLALVVEGRTGKDVAVQDHALLTLDTAEFITMTLTLEELLAAIAALSEEDKAQLVAAMGPNGDVAVDEEGKLTPEQQAAAAETAETLNNTAEAASAGAAAASEAAETGDDDKAAEAASAAEAVAGMAEQADAEADTLDAANKRIKALEGKLATMDTGALLKEIGSRDALASRVSEFTGNFDHSAMTCDQVAQYGVKKLGINCKKGTEGIALDAWMQGRTPPREQVSDKVALDGRTNGQNLKGKFWSDKK